MFDISIGNILTVAALAAMAAVVFKQKDGLRSRKPSASKKIFLEIVSRAAGIWAAVFGRIAKPFIFAWTDERANRFMDWVFRSSPLSSSNLLVRGGWADRFALAKSKYDPKKYPSLWFKSCPEDLKRSAVWDGRIITGEPLSIAAEASLGAEHGGNAFRAGVGSFIVWTTLLLAAWQPQIYFDSVRSGVAASQAESSAKLLADDSRILASMSEDYWDEGSRKAAVEARRAELASGKASKLPAMGELVLGLIDPARIAFALLGGLFLGLCAFRGTVRSAIASAGSALHDGSKEQIVRWKYRQEQRQTEYDTWCQQIVKATTYDKSPLFSFGKATGSFRFRGRLDAPYKGQSMKMSMGDMHQNVMLIGGIGSGKTFRIITPIVRQLLTLRAKEKAKARTMAKKIASMGRQVAPAEDEFQWPHGIAPLAERYEKECLAWPFDISLYMTDGKAVLYHDLKKMAKRLGQEDDLMVLGCDDENGEYSVDLLDGITPQLVADILKSVASQSGGGGKTDEFWSNMATECVRNCAVVARVFDMTPSGLEWKIEHGERPYSLVFLYQLALDPGPLVEQVFQAIQDTLETDFELIRQYATTELFDAMTYFSRDWLPMVSQTRDGIKANIIDAMGTFANNTVLRRSFSSGAGAKLADVRQFWGKLVCTNLPQDEYGIAGRIINVFLKTLFMTEAVKREKRTKLEMSNIEKRLFEKHPNMSMRLIPLAQMEDRLDLLSDDDQYQWGEWRAACESANSLADALVEVGRPIDLPQKKNDPMDDLLSKLDFLGKYKEQLSEDDEAILLRPITLEKRFRESCDAAQEKAFLEDDGVFSPEAIKGDEEALELYYRWKVLSTKLSREKMFFFADEVQTLVTVDPKEAAQSDSSFWNVSRAAGVAGFVATQSYAALKQAIGQEACDNFCNNFRSKIFLSVEDPSTIEFIKKMAGKTLRSFTYEADGFESYDAMLHETGMPDPFMEEPRMVALGAEAPTGSSAIRAGLEMAFNPGKYLSATDYLTSDEVKPDHRFISPAKRSGTWRGGVSSSYDQIQSQLKSAHDRAQDLTHKKLAEGNQETEVFRDDEFLMMGENHAYMYLMRAGKSRQDIVKLFDTTVEID